MTDEELIARLRDGCNLQQRDGERAADRIEALIAEGAKLRQMWLDACDVTDLAGTIADLEAKLAQAVEGLSTVAVQRKTSEMTPYEIEHSEFRYGYNAVISSVRATLAEIKGNKL